MSTYSATVFILPPSPSHLLRVGDVIVCMTNREGLCFDSMLPSGGPVDPWRSACDTMTPFPLVKTLSKHTPDSTSANMRAMAWHDNVSTAGVRMFVVFIETYIHRTAAIEHDNAHLYRRARACSPSQRRATSHRLAETAECTRCTVRSDAGDRISSFVRCSLCFPRM